MDDCIFCKIAAGNMPSHKIYEDELTLAFLDIYPPFEGYTIVIPKKHSPYVWDMENEDYLKLMETVKKTGQKIREAYPSKLAGVHIEGLHVEHTHVKVFPFSTPGEFHKEGDMSQEPDHDKLAAVAKKLKLQ